MAGCTKGGFYYEQGNANKILQRIHWARILENLADDNKPTTYDIAIREVKPTTIFDSALFRKEYASLYNKYRTKEKAGYVTIKVTRL